jgi:hypothetical protein
MVNTLLPWQLRPSGCQRGRMPSIRAWAPGRLRSWGTPEIAQILGRNPAKLHYNPSRKSKLPEVAPLAATELELMWVIERPAGCSFSQVRDELRSQNNFAHSGIRGIIRMREQKSLVPSATAGLRTREPALRSRALPGLDFAAVPGVAAIPAAGAWEP